MKNIVTQALITMGYRKADENVFMKPIGYAILIATILYSENGELQVEIKLGFNNSKTGEYMIWNHAVFVWTSTNVNAIKEKLNMDENKIYERSCEEIANAEAYIGLEHANLHSNYKTFAFRTPNDINQLVNL